MKALSSRRDFPREAANTQGRVWKGACKVYMIKTYNIYGRACCGIRSGPRESVTSVRNAPDTFENELVATNEFHASRFDK